MRRKLLTVTLVSAAVGFLCGYLTARFRPTPPATRPDYSHLAADVHVINQYGPPGSHLVLRPFRYSADGRTVSLTPQPADDSEVWAITLDGGRVCVAATSVTP